MKSKSLELNVDTTEEGKAEKIYGFVNLYKTAAETRAKLSKKPKTVENLDNEDGVDGANKKKRVKSPSKKKKKGGSDSLDISHINKVESAINGKCSQNSPASVTRATSTAVASRNSRSTEPKVKSIMKNSITNTDEAMDGSAPDTPTTKPKKRNKSVSFMLDENEEIATKKTKSEASLNIEKKNVKEKHFDKKALKKLKKAAQAEKENKTKVNMDIDQNNENTDKVQKKEKPKSKVDAAESSDAQIEAQDKKKRFKKLKKRKKFEETEATENDSNNNEESSEQKPRKSKKKKRTKSQPSEANDGEPASKVKKEVKEVAEDLENLSIGDNPHMLTSLLDEMTVVDKDKKKKSKLRRKRDKDKKPGSVSSSETADLEKIEEGKEKVKWKKRKWNKDKKGDVDEDVLLTSVVVENLPLKMVCNYKKLLSDHFGKLGLIKRIGIAEVYPTEESRPVFTTNIVFYSEGAANKALEEDNTVVEGSRVRVRKPLPPTQTTVVVRSYADLSEQTLSSAFSSAGRIRAIRHLVKGRKSMMTAFIEFDGPSSVERALKLAADARVGGKRLHVSRFELRGGKRRGPKDTCDSENEGDSEDSND